jgi:hypothetical protein
VSVCVALASVGLARDVERHREVAWEGREEDREQVVHVGRHVVHVLTVTRGVLGVREARAHGVVDKEHRVVRVPRRVTWDEALPVLRHREGTHL